MFHVSDEKIPELKRLFEEFCASVEKGSTVDFCGTDSFKQKVIFLSINKDSVSFEMLKKLNAHLHDLFLPYFEAGGNRNYLPEVFFPHVALAVKLSPEQFEKGISWAHPPASGGRVFFTYADAPFAPSDELKARTLCGAPYPCAKIQAVSLARCNPYEEIARHSLTDVLSPSQRHNNMSHIRSTGGSLETSLRSQLFRFGFRFRKNDKRLSGSPDIVFPHYKAVIFVNGCFWHAHGWKSEESLIKLPMLDESVLYSLRCDKFRMPSTNYDFWQAKFIRNRERDLRDIEKLLSDGWRVGVVWECSITGRRRSEKIRSVAEKISLWLEEEYSALFREF